jgi:hypothetical protein
MVALRSSWAADGSRAWTLTAAVTIGLWAVVPLEAQEPLVLQRLAGAIVLDGRIDEPAWKLIAPLPVAMNAPNFGAAPTERTEFLVGYTDEYLYVAGRMYDSSSSGVQGSALNRDHLSTSTDWLAVVLDSYNDNENALLFGTTPTGLRSDYEITDDAKGPNNLSWNTHWDVAVTRSDSGWFAELRIPFSSLRFQDDQGRVVMGLSVWRYIARKNEMDVFPEIRPDWGFLSVNKPSQARDVVFEGVRRRNPLYLTPYLLAGEGRTAELRPGGLSYGVAASAVHEMGLDLKYAVKSNLTLDLTANTDFAQVEADDQQVNLTRFSLFFPEKRQFFQERSGIFEFRTGESDRLFYSRRIGLDNGQPVRLYGGGRLISRAGEWDLGMLDMQTAPTERTGSENFGVLRARRRVINTASYVGGMLTTRTGNDGRYNVALGVDAIIRPYGNDFVELNVVQTTDDSSQLRDRLEASLFRLKWERRTATGLGYDFSASRVGERYDPAIGFVSRRGVVNSRQRLSYGWIAGGDSPVLRQQLVLSGSAFLGTQDRSVESSDIRGEWSLETKSGALVALFATRLFDRPAMAFALSDDVGVPAGRYAFQRVGGTLRLPNGGLLLGQINAELGSFYDGTQLSVGTRPTWHVSRHLELGSEYQHYRVRFPERNQQLQTHIGRVRARAMIDTHLSATTFVQYTSAIDAVIGNVRIRYNPREGTDLYLVYNHLLNADRARVEPMLPVTGNRTLLLKYSYTYVSTP